MWGTLGRAIVWTLARRITNDAYNVVKDKRTKQNEKPRKKQRRNDPRDY